MKELWDSPRSANPPRMLLQDASTGYWTLMDSNAELDYLKLLIRRGKQPMIKYLNKHLRHAIADARFGRRRETSMTKKHTMALLEDFKQKLIPTESSSESQPDRTNGIVFHRSVSLLRMNAPTIKLLRSATTLLRPASAPHYLSTGSRVWAASGTGERFYGRWEGARVVEVMDNGLIEVVYDKDGMKQRTVSPGGRV